MAGGPAPKTETKAAVSTLTDIPKAASSTPPPAAKAAKPPTGWTALTHGRLLWAAGLVGVLLLSGGLIYYFNRPRPPPPC